MSRQPRRLDLRAQFGPSLGGRRPPAAPSSGWGPAGAGQPSRPTPRGSGREGGAAAEPPRSGAPAAAPSLQAHPRAGRRRAHPLRSPPLPPASRPARYLPRGVRRPAAGGTCTRRGWRRPRPAAPPPPATAPAPGQAAGRSAGPVAWAGRAAGPTRPAPAESRPPAANRRPPSSGPAGPRRNGRAWRRLQGGGDSALRPRRTSAGAGREAGAAPRPVRARPGLWGEGSRPARPPAAEETSLPDRGLGAHSLLKLGLGRRVASAGKS